MAGIFAAVSSVANVIESVNTAVKDPNVKNVNDAINTLNKMGQGDALLESKGSITRFLSPYIVEPVIIASKSAKEEEIFSRVVSMCTDIFSGFYLQAFETLNGYMGTNIMNTVDILSTGKGDMLDFVTAGTTGTISDVSNMVDSVSRVSKLKWNSMEKPFATVDNFNYMGKLMSKDSKLLSLSINREEKVSSTNGNIELRDTTDKKDMGNSLYAANFRQLKVTTTLVTKTPEGESVTRTIIVPISIRAHIIAADINDIANLINPRSKDKSFASRFMEWRSGGISFKDLIFCGDLIKEYKANRIKDKQDLMGKLLQREISAGSRTDGDKFEKFYNMYVITKDDKNILDKQLRGNIQDEKYKQQFLEAGLGLSLTIIDPDYERVEMSIKDIRGCSTTTFKNIEKRKDNQNDYEKIMQALLMNRPMAF